MIKKLLIVTAWVVMCLRSDAQAPVMLTEVNPITSKNTEAKFFELYYSQTSTATVLDNYYFAAFTKKGSNNPRLFVGKMHFGLAFYNSTTSPETNFTKGSLVCAQFTESSLFSNNQRTVPEVAKISWETLFNGINGNWAVYNYNSGDWSASTNPIFDPFENYSPKDKIAVMLFKRASTGELELVDAVADVLSTGQEIATLDPLSKTINGEPISIDFINDVKIGYNKYVNEALGTNNPYQLVKQNKSKLPSCELVWKKLSNETPGEFSGVLDKFASWDVTYYVPNSSTYWSDIVGDPSNYNDHLEDLLSAGSLPSKNFTKIGDGSFYELKLVLKLSNFQNINNYDNLISSFYIDADDNKKIGDYVQQGSGVAFVYEDNYLYDNLIPTHALGAYNIEGVNTGLLFQTYSTFSVNGISPLLSILSAGEPQIILVDFRVRIPAIHLQNNSPLWILTGYKKDPLVDPVGVDYCFGTERIFRLPPSALPAQFKTSAVKIVDGKARFTWTTSSEQNNKGFEVQRSVGNTNDFKTIGFVGTRAKGGNSQTEINYSFDDADLKAGVVHYYRLNQVDFDGKAMLTPIKSIKPGSIETDLSVYPNPNQGSFLVNASKLSGKVSIFLIDNTGRVLNHFNNVAESTTRISNLKTGFYTLKIVNTETGEQTAQRIVVQ